MNPAENQLHLNLSAVIADTVPAGKREDSYRSLCAMFSLDPHPGRVIELAGQDWNRPE
jgi:hypothetical protein